MKIRCIDNNLCSTLTLNKEYIVLEEAPEYYVILDDKNDETTCRKTRFEVVEDGGITKKAKATITELNYQLENEFRDIRKFDIRKNSKGEIKEISIKFKYNL
ncbi:hypothetical protein [Clostridium sp.]|uniref:hypothetical protein n=1 Tax=Clostridium sp. TaxID=1506 RepID=UPI00283B159D|nr:hypothetical protein [Clostridium sp.]MDR3596123.1 hypothetical protein [Clostridium sp.]